MRSISAAIIALVLMYVAIDGKKLDLFIARALCFTWSCILLLASLLFMAIGI